MIKESVLGIRDLYPEMDDQGLQEIRDACVDLSWGAEEIEDKDKNEPVQGEIKQDHYSYLELGIPQFRSGIPDKWALEREKDVKKQGDVPYRPWTSSRNQKTLADLTTSVMRQISVFVKVKVCSKNIHHYRSKKGVSRSGWLHVSILAKDSYRHKAVELCRNWEQFWG